MTSTIAQNLKKINDIKADIMEEINAKGGSLLPSSPFSDYPQAIAQIPTGSPSEIIEKVSAGYVISSLVNGTILDESSDYSITENVLVSGSPTIVLGVITSWNSSKYAYIGDSFNPGTSDWEFQVLYRTSSTAATQWIFCSGSPVGIGLGITSANKVCCYLSSNGSSWDIANNIQSSDSVAVGVYYYFKVSFSQSVYRVEVSTDGITFNEFITVDSSSSISSSSIRFGISNSGGYSNLSGACLDLKQSFIKIGGSIWWTGIV